MTFKQIEVAVAMQEFLIRFDAECGDYAVNRLSYRDASGSQLARVPRTGNGHRSTAARENLKGQELFLDLPENAIVCNSLQHFTQNKIGQTKPLASQFSVQPFSLGI